MKINAIQPTEQPQPKRPPQETPAGLFASMLVQAGVLTSKELNEKSKALGKIRF